MAQQKKQRTQGKRTYTGEAVRTQSAFLCGKQYYFIKGKTYEIESKEAFIKLTNKTQPVLIAKGV